MDESSKNELLKQLGFSEELLQFLNGTENQSSAIIIETPVSAEFISMGSTESVELIVERIQKSQNLVVNQV